MALNKRSRIVTHGVQRSPNRAMLRAVGFKDADFNKPIVGIANGYSTITPCNLGLDTLARRAEGAARRRSTGLCAGRAGAFRHDHRIRHAPHGCPPPGGPAGRRAPPRRRGWESGEATGLPLWRK